MSSRKVKNRKKLERANLTKTLKKMYPYTGIHGDIIIQRYYSKRRLTSLNKSNLSMKDKIILLARAYIRHHLTEYEGLMHKEGLTRHKAIYIISNQVECMVDRWSGEWAVDSENLECGSCKTQLDLKKKYFNKKEYNMMVDIYQEGACICPKCGRKNPIRGDKIYVNGKFKLGKFRLLGGNRIIALRRN
jgi:hypothetical protein